MPPRVVAVWAGKTLRGQLRLNINRWEDIISLSSSSMPLIVEHGYHFMPLHSVNIQRCRKSYG